MKYLDEFRTGSAAAELAAAIAAEAGDRPLTFMEVCGTHTMSIARNGIKQLLPGSVRLISGPGCPVCVTPNRIIDQAVALAREPGVIITTFGDMMRVPGSSSSLEAERAAGHDVRMVSSSTEALKTARMNPDRQVVFIGVGFETTAPSVAASIIDAEHDGIKNYSVVCAHKLVLPAMCLLCSGTAVIDGFLCPGHVSAVIGTRPYQVLAEEYGRACVVGGFEALDILQSLLMLIRQAVSGRAAVENQYTRVVKPEGNPLAAAFLDRVFLKTDSEWRGIGMIPDSGLRIRDEYVPFDADRRFAVQIEGTREPEGCLCGRVLQGLSEPQECRLFGRKCLPENPVGPCMVSSEGACAAAYRYQETK